MRMSDDPKRDMEKAYSIALNTIEAVRGKEFNKKTLETTFRIGIAVIGTLMAFTIINDISGYLNRFFN